MMRTVRVEESIIIPHLQWTHFVLKNRHLAGGPKG